MDFSIRSSRDMGLGESRDRLKQSLQKYQDSISNNSSKEMMIAHYDFCKKQHDFEYLYNRYLLIEKKKNKKSAKLV
ncbi:hypothetical protein [Photobacterium damselae]|uniref:hypothetical protein n=1 Tax=Photobacterium damselae TaxID=38293 RepID=UPI001F2EC0F8|nr:hypothetical protein [Photobacterium damselae]UKA03983.1 hypothetical protein IHC89_15760 [Photobacterium damselae subsp. damselae]UKA04003.1 hypothetical protein IHC89_15860 [Photobacterium damselae subsp. damselae]